MALDDNDRKEIVQLIRTELGKVLAEAAKTGGAGGLDIRQVGTPVGVGQAVPNRGRMLASDNCCNGCD